VAVIPTTRGRRGASWTLITPDNHYVSRLPGLRGATLVKLVTPRLAGARFAQYLIDLAPGGALDGGHPGHEHFLYVLDGATSSPGNALSTGSFAYYPPGDPPALETADGARLLWIQRPYESLPSYAAPTRVCGHRDDAAFEQLAVPGLRRRELLSPADPAFDFAMSLLRFSPGAALDRVEIHDEEHGLYIIHGAGRYLLDRDELDVRTGDFIYMGPYCPQSFAAHEASGAEYLLYKDAFRVGFAAETAS